VTALLAMDAPIGRDAQSMQAEKLRLFRAMRPLDPKQVVRGQFRGYRQESGVAPDSQVETFAALRLHIDTWRWADVPFYIRAGKCLPLTTTEVVVNLKCPPLAIFGPQPPTPANYFRFRLSPEVVICAGAQVKRFGEDMRGESVELIARHESRTEISPYERLLSSAIVGDTTLFTRDDSVEAAWRVVDPVLGGAVPLVLYEPGSWGPAESSRLISEEAAWHDPQVEKTSPC
jgi:glucose-6-phosphate 1-dehydrogenase